MVSPAGYDAFVSYSHHHDGSLAAALQTGLEQLAKPWYRIRALHIFRDTASLSANPALWPSIENALISSRWFLLLASVDAAESAWVNREVEWWLAHRSPDGLLILATSPGLAWDNEKRDWVAGAPVPPALRGAYTDEPLWVDLSEVRLAGHRPQLPADLLAAVVAPLRGVPKDTIIGEHLREHRRTMRLARGAVAVLATLLVLAIVATFVAVGQRDTARTQARLATSRELAALATADLATHVDLAQLLAVAAHRTDRNPQTDAALAQAVATSPHLVRYLQAPSQVTALATSADGNVAVAGTADGQLIWFDLTTGHHVIEIAGHDGVTDVAVSADGRSVAAITRSSAVFWDIRAGKRQPFGTERFPKGVALSPSGRLAAVLYAAGTANASMLVWNKTSGRIIRAPVSDIFQHVAMPTESSVNMIENDLSGERWSAFDLRKVASFGGPQTPLSAFTPGMSADGGYVGFAQSGFVGVAPTKGNNSHPGGTVFGPIAPIGPASVLAIGRDGKSVAVAQNGTIYVAPLAKGKLPQPGQGVTELTGGGDITAVCFLGTDDRLVAAVGTSLALWDLRQTSRLARPMGVSLPFTGNASTPPTLLPSPDGRWFAVTGGIGSRVSVFRAGSPPSLVRTITGSFAQPVWRGDQLMLVSPGGKGLDISQADGHAVTSWSASSVQAYNLASARILPGGEQLATVDASGGMHVYDMRTGAVRQIVPDFSTYALQADISPDGTGAVISEVGSNQVLGSAPPRVLYVDLRTRASHLVGSGLAASVLFTRNRLMVQRRTGALEVWDLSGRRRLQVLPGTGDTTGGLSVSTDGTLVARLRGDGMASVSDLATGDVLSTFSLPLPATVGADPWDATAMIFAPTGKELLTATSGGQMIRWILDGADLARTACATVGRGLTQAEWLKYAHTPPPSDLPCAGMQR